MEHLSLDALAAGYATLPAAPRGRGSIRRVVVRDPGERRVLPGKITVRHDVGVVGDRWSLGATPNVEAQVTVMRADVAGLMAVDGDIARFGDNLFVDLDLSEEALPAGSRLRAGSALLEVTPKPHTGCHKFKARAGEDALAMTRDERWRHLRLRGIHARVVEAGEIAEGDAIVVVPR